MPVFRVQVFYKHGLADKWTNVYHVDAAGIVDAGAGFQAACEAPLLACIATVCSIEKFLVSDPASAAYVEIPVNLAGTNGDTGSLIPFFNSIKVRFTTAAPGRPDYKFYKGFLGENVQDNGVVSTPTQTAFYDNLSGMLTDSALEGATLCSEAGDTWNGVIVQPAIQMRQMHRKRRRRSVAI